MRVGGKVGNRALIFVRVRMVDQSPDQTAFCEHLQSYRASLGASSIQIGASFSGVVGLEFGDGINCCGIDRGG